MSGYVTHRNTMPVFVVCIPHRLVVMFFRRLGVVNGHQCIVVLFPMRQGIGTLHYILGKITFQQDPTVGVTVSDSFTKGIEGGIEIVLLGDLQWSCPMGLVFISHGPVDNDVQTTFQEFEAWTYGGDERQGLVGERVVYKRVRARGSPSVATKTMAPSVTEMAVAA